MQSGVQAIRKFASFHFWLRRSLKPPFQGSSKSTVASLAVAVVLLGIVAFCASLLRESTSAIQELTRASETRAEEELTEIIQLFQEHENFVGLTARRGYIARNSLQFMQRCRHELENFCKRIEYQSIAPEIFGESLLRLSQLEILAGDQTESVRHLESCIQVSEEYRILRLQGNAYNSLGVLAAKRGEYGEALRLFGVATEVLNQLPEEKELHVLAFRNYAICNWELGNRSMAPFRDAVQAASMSEEIELNPLSEIYVDSLISLAQHLEESGQIGQAKVTVAQASSVLQELISLCNVNYMTGEIASARRYAQALSKTQEFRSRLDARSPSSKSSANAGVLLDEMHWPWLFERIAAVVDGRFKPKMTMGAEFEKQSALLVAWTDFENVNQVVSEIIKKTWDRLQLVVIVRDENAYYDVVDLLSDHKIPRERVRFSFIDLDSCWLRDLGPINGRDSASNSIWFDAQVVRSWRKQQVVADGLPAILERGWRTARYTSSLFMEGGSLLASGNGLTFCSSSIPLINARFGFSADATDKEVRRITGASELVFVDPLVGEPTGHIDMFMTVVSPTQVVIGEYRNKQDPNAATLDSNAQKIASLTYNGQDISVTRVPMPKSKLEWANYTNVVYANGVLLVPSWGEAHAPMEKEVHAIYSQLLPGWKILSIDCSGLVNAGGALHCLTCNLGTAVPVKKGG